MAMDEVSRDEFERETEDDRKAGRLAAKPEQDVVLDKNLVSELELPEDTIGKNARVWMDMSGEIVGVWILDDEDE